MSIGLLECPPPPTTGKVEFGFSPKQFAWILFGLLLLTFFEVIFGQRTFIYRDFGYFAYPLAYYHRHQFWNGAVPLWNPLNNCGVPFLAQWNTLSLYPFSLFYLLFPLSWSLAVFSLGHLFLAGLGMYFLALRWVQNRLAASVAGLAFAFNGLTLNCLLWTNNMAALGWMPWVIWLTEMAWKEGGRRLILAGLAGAMQMLAGAPEMILITWLFAALLWVMEWWHEKRARLRLFQRFWIVVLLVAGLSAAQLLPFLDLLAHSQRDSKFGNSFWAMPGWGWANFLLPLFFSYPLSHEVYFQYNQLWTSSYYVGAGVLALALIAMLRLRERRIGLLALATALGLVLALGDNGFVYGWLRKLIPALGWVRFPVKFVVLVVFSVPLLAAYGIRRLANLPESQWKSEARLSFVVWLNLLAVAGLLIWFARKFPQYAPPYDHWDATWRNGVLRLLFLSLLLGIALAISKARLRRDQWLWQAALLLGIWLDVLTSSPKQPPTAARSVYEPGLNYISPLPTHGQSRAMMSREAFLKLYEPTSLDVYTNYLCNRLALNCNLNLLDGISKVDGFYSLNLRQTEEVRSVLYARAVQPPSPLLDFLNVSHVTAPGKYLDWVKRDHYLPLITAGQKPVFADAITTLRGLISTNFDARQAVYLPLETRAHIAVTNESVARILSPQIHAQRLDFQVDAAAPSLVVVAQSFYHPWHAYVNGRRVPLWRANHAFQALPVGSGLSQVRVIYEDRIFQCGACLSGAALVLSLTAWLRLARRNKSAADSAPGEKPAAS